MPASAPRSSTARTIPRCQRDSACLGVVRVAFIAGLSRLEVLPDEDDFIRALERAEGGAGAWVIRIRSGARPVALQVAAARGGRGHRASANGSAGRPARRGPQVRGEKHAAVVCVARLIKKQHPASATKWIR